jgi:hypothetical protein
MPARKHVPPPAPEEATVAEPPYYEATEDLFIDNPESGSMPVAAFRTGSQVAPDLVEANGWGGKVRVPEQFAGQLVPPPSPAAEAAEPETTAASAAGEE